MSLSLLHNDTNRSNLIDGDTLTRNTATTTKLTAAELNIIVKHQENATVRTPVAIIFGWGGASHKNVSKYSSIYYKTGCTTVQYILPTRHLFRDTDQIPDIMENILEQLDDMGLVGFGSPTFIHCLCDTGVMCYQGMDIAMKRSGRSLNIKGVVWDSCPGPYPEVSFVRYTVFTVVFLLCCARDWAQGDATLLDFFRSIYFLVAHRIIPSIKKKIDGIPITFGLIQGVWAGHFARDHCKSRKMIPELFLYSNNDYYLSFQYLETMVLDIRQRTKSPFRAVRFSGSPHVAHLRHFSVKYKQEIADFLAGHMKFGQTSY